MPYGLFDYTPDNTIHTMGWQYDPNKSAEENEFEKQKALAEERKKPYGGADALLR